MPKLTIGGLRLCPLSKAALVARYNTHAKKLALQYCLEGRTEGCIALYSLRVLLQERLGPSCSAWAMSMLVNGRIRITAC